MSRKSLVWTALSFVAAGFASACGRDGAPGGAAEGPSWVRVGPQDVAIVTRGRLQTGPRIAGSLEARATALVRAELSGTVEEIGPEMGEPVAAGQVLARIEDRALEQAVSSALAGLRASERDLAVARHDEARARALVAAGGLARRELEAAHAQLASAQARRDEARARLESARTQLADATVRAPFSGVVGERHVGLGDVVTPGTPLYTILDPSTMRLRADVPAEDIAALRVGAPVWFEVRGYPGRDFTGQIERIAPAADPATRQVRILVAIPNPGRELVAGLFAEGRVNSEAHLTLIAPLAAVDASGEVATVMRVRNGVVERVPVVLGVRDDERELVEIASGLEAGDVILRRGARALPAGTRVEVDAFPTPLGHDAAEPAGGRDALPPAVFPPPR